jgi:DnaJ family protein C protein 11
MGKFPLSYTQINWLTILYRKASLKLSRPYKTKFGVDYEDADNSIQFKAGFLPFAAVTNILAETSFSFSRRLWRRQPQRGKVTIRFGRQPSASFMFISPSPLNVISEESTPPHLLPTISGLKQMVFDKRIGIIFANFLPTIFAEATLMLVQLSTLLKCSLHYDLISGFTYTLGGHWSSETSEIGAALILNMSGISWQLESAVSRYFFWVLFIYHVFFRLDYLEQRITLPIVLSTEYSPLLALATVIIPSTAAVFGYHFVVVPRRRNRWNT